MEFKAYNYSIVFLLGILIGGILSSIVPIVSTASDAAAGQDPKLFYFSAQNESSNKVSTAGNAKKLSLDGILGKDPDDVPSPYDWIKEEQIKVYNNRIIIDLSNPEWAAFTDTNSMDPVIDGTSNAIEIVPKSEEDIHVGDIVSYKSEYAEGTIIHRVIKTDKDNNGIYFIMKGDNNPNPDPGKIRFSQIQRVLVAIIY